MNIQKKPDLFESAAPIGNLPIPRETIEQIVGYRNEAIALYAEAFEAIALADAAVKKAAAKWKLASPGVTALKKLRRFSEPFVCRTAINICAWRGD